MDKTKKYVITINRELGSGGRTIGRKLAERLGVKFYDKAVINELVKQFGLSVEEIEKLKAKKHHWWNDLSQSYIDRGNIEARFGNQPIVATTENIYQIETEVLKGIAEDESCVIAGRSGFAIFKDEPNSFKILIESKMPERIARVMREQDLTEEEAVKAIKKVDEGRENYTKQFANTSRYDSRNYDLVLNVAHLTEDQAVDIIMYILEK